MALLPLLRSLLLLLQLLLRTFPFMHGTWFGCYFCIGTNQDVDGPVLLDPFLSLMAQYYWLFPDKDCLRWLQPEIFSCQSSHKLTPYSVSASPCRLLACISFPCWVGIGGWLRDPALWRFGDWRTHAYREGCLGISRFVYCLWGPYFHTCQSPTLQNCFGQVMHNLGNRVALIFSSLDFSIPQSLVQTLEFGIVLTLVILWIVLG